MYKILKKYSWAIATIITLAFILIFLKSIKIEELQTIAVTIKYEYFLAGFAFHFCAYLFRVIRLSLIQDYKSTGNKDIFYILSIHNFYNQLLPANTGELAFPILLKKYLKIGYAKSTVLLFQIRILDILSVFIFLSLGLLISNVSTSTPLFIYKESILYISLSFTAIIIALFIVSYSFNIPEYNNKSKYGFINKVFNLIHEFQRITKETNLFYVILISLLSNLFVVFTFWAVLRSLNLEIDIFTTMIASTILLPISILPVKGIAGLGTVEGGWTFSLWLLSIKINEGLGLSFALHIITFLYASVFFVLSILKLKNKHINT